MLKISKYIVLVAQWVNEFNRMKGIKCKDFEIRTNYRACLKLIVISVHLVKYRITMAGLALLMLMTALHDKIKFQKSYRFEKQIKQKQISYVIETLYLN